VELKGIKAKLWSYFLEPKEHQRGQATLLKTENFKPPPLALR
jgi:hypothetical protein